MATSPKGKKPEPLKTPPKQKAKLTTLGGAKWVRAKLDEQPDK